MTTLSARCCLAAVFLILTGCGGPSGTQPHPSVVQPVTVSPSTTNASTITIKQFAFTPVTLTVKPGTKVTVTNNDTTAHTATHFGAQSFDTGSIAAGQTGTFTAPREPGSYPYVCSIHPFMKGTLVVK